MLVGLLTEHANLRYMLRKIGRIKLPSCRKCRAEGRCLYILRVFGVREGEEKNLWQEPDGTGPGNRNEVWHRGCG